ncbi:helix-turn-helix domain-containing protein [Planctomycetota bacterium]
METPDFLFDLKILTYNYFKGHTWVFENLSAPFWRLYWHTHPGIWMKLNEESITTSPEEFTLIAPYTPLKACGITKPHHFYIHFLAGYPFNVIPSKVFTYSALKRNIKSVKILVNKIEDKSVLTAEDSLMCIRVCAEALSNVPWKQWRRSTSDKRILLVDSFMSEHINTVISNDELAKIAHMVPNAFIRFFKQITGLTPQKYFAQKKIERACFILQYHDISIEGIADMLGFSDRYHFSRVFKKLIGAGPAGYRKTVRKN